MLRPRASLRSLALLLSVCAAPSALASVLQPTTWSRLGGQAGAALGQSVAPAGDVDGDGFSDLLVGVPGYDTGQANAGAAFLYLGGVAGPGATPAWSFLGTQTGAAIGTTVAPAGDVNNDGFADVLVGAPLFNAAGGSDHGRVYLFLGSATGLAISPHQTLTGSLAGAQFGYSIATAGDVNADGYDDVLIGAPLFNDTFLAEGAVRLYHGGPAGLTGPVSTKYGGSVGALLGYAVSGAGDADGDGFDDLVVGAPGKSVDFTRDGAAFLYRGSVGGLMGSAAASLNGASDSAAFGASVSRAGDVNGDGYADVLVGSPNRKFQGIAYGEATLYSGATGGLGSVLWQGSGTTARSYFGVSVATAGDLNGDCRADFVIGSDRWPQPSSRMGQAFVYLGAPGTPGLDARFDGSTTGQALGICVATAGDIDGDGFSDLVLGEPGADGGLAGEGRVTLYRGAASKPVIALGFPVLQFESNALLGYAIAGGIDEWRVGADHAVISAPGSDQGLLDAGILRSTTVGLPSTQMGSGYFAAGDRAGAGIGRALARAGDVNGDGYEDLIAGSTDYSNGEEYEGVAQLFLGGPGSFGSTPAWSFEPNVAEAGAGRAVAGGDFNGDGFADVLVGLFSSSLSGPGFDGSGIAFYGSALGLSAAPDWATLPVSGNTWFGAAVATGDWDADGYTDAAIGAPFESNGEFREGRVHVYFGGPSGLEPTAGWILEANIASGAFGYALDNAGDVNGDGVGDLLIGSPGTPSGGLVYVFRGNRARAVPELKWARVIASDIPTITFGGQVCGIGDIDKDGMGDFLVAAPRYSGGQSSEGRVTLFRGSVDGGELSPWWSEESNIPDANFGHAMARLGDSNRDGWPDFAVGAPFHGSGGAVYVYEGGGRGLWHVTSQTLPSQTTAFIPLRGTSANPNAIGVEVTGRSAAGRVRTRGEVQLGTQNEAWLGGARTLMGPYETSPPNGPFGSMVRHREAIGGLAPGIAYRWRERSVLRSAYFPHTPWSQPRAYETAEHHFRTLGPSVSVGDPKNPATGLRLGAPEPSPFRESTRIRYSLPRAGHVAVSLFDARGRHVRRLEDRREDAGNHDLAFDGRDERGQVVPGGVYFVVLDLDGERRVRKLVRLP